MSDTHAPPLDDEPKSPMWLPALGAALFLGAGLWWAVTPAAVQPAPDTAASASAVAVAAEPPEAHAARPGMPPGRPPRASPCRRAIRPWRRGGAMPGGHMQNLPVASGTTLQQRIQGMRDQLRAHPPPAAPPAGGH